MISEVALTESANLRKQKLVSIDNSGAAIAMHKAKTHALFQAIWRCEAWATTTQIAEYYEVTEEVVRDNLRRNREEFEFANIRTLTGKDLLDAREIISLPSKASQATIFSPRAGLLLGMLLRDSEVAKAVRVALLDLAEAAVAVALIPEIDTTSVEVATLEAIGKTAEAIASLHRAQMNKLSNIENLVQGSAVDIKGEVRYAADTIEDKVEVVQLSLLEELASLKEDLQQIQKQTEKKPKERVHYTLAVHLTPEEHAKIVAIIDSLGMSRNQFLYTLVKPYLED